MQLLKHLLDFLRLGALEISSWIVLLLTVLTTIDVTLRYLLRRAVPGIMELSQVLLVIFVFLSLAQVQKNKEHVTVDFLFNKAPPKIKCHWEAVTYLFPLAFFLTLFAESIGYFWESFTMREYYGAGIRVPIYPGKAAIVIGTGLVIIELIRDITRLATQLINRRKFIHKDVTEKT
jgi:TRAP-type C4-dicarboxylate transport system permease small subunit